jgi:phosphoglycolate phosphatase
MMTIAAAYGFCGEALPPHEWGADALIRHPAELQAVLKIGLTRG